MERKAVGRAGGGQQQETGCFAGLWVKTLRSERQRVNTQEVKRVAGRLPEGGEIQSSSSAEKEGTSVALRKGREAAKGRSCLLSTRHLQQCWHRRKAVSEFRWREECRSAADGLVFSGMPGSRCLQPCSRLSPECITIRLWLCALSAKLSESRGSSLCHIHPPSPVAGTGSAESVNIRRDVRVVTASCNYMGVSSC